MSLEANASLVADMRGSAAVGLIHIIANRLLEGTQLFVVDKSNKTLDGPAMSIAAAMQAKGFTDATLAQTLDVSPETVRLWRHGQRNPAPQKAQALNRALGIPLHILRPDIYPAPTPAERTAA